jgi:hypothetical protein
VNGTTRAGVWTAAVTVACGTLNGAGFVVNDHPADRFPQWTHRRKIWPGSHHIP